MRDAVIRRLLRMHTTAAVFVCAFTLAAAATLTDGVGGVGGDALSLAYGAAAAIAVGWASIRSGDPS